MQWDTCDMKTKRTKEILFTMLMATPLATSGCVLPADEVGGSSGASGESGECRNTTPYSCGQFKDSATYNQCDWDTPYNCWWMYSCEGEPPCHGDDGGGGGGGGGRRRRRGGGGGECRNTTPYSCGQFKDSATYNQCDWDTPYNCWWMYSCEGEPPCHDDDGSCDNPKQTTFQVLRYAESINATGGQRHWDDLANGTQPNTKGADFSVSSQPARTHYLRLRNGGFNVPSDATIVGIEARLSMIRRGNGTFTMHRLKLEGAPESRARIIPWSSNYTLYDGFGGANDTWGKTWTPAQINSRNFGLRLIMDADPMCSDDDCPRQSFGVDYADINVWYCD